MRFPAVGGKAKRVISIPELSGGINYRDNPTECNDNQLTDSVNMWYMGGSLKTRPGICTAAVMTAKGYDKSVNFRQTDVFIGGGKLVFYNLSGSENTSEDGITATFEETHFWLQKSDTVTGMPTLKGVRVSFVCLKNGCIYAFAQVNAAIYRLKFTYKDGEVEFAENWECVSESDYYVPTVMTHCKSSHTLSDRSAYTLETDGTMLEGYNVIGNYYKMIYSTVNTAASVSSDSYVMVYGIIENTYADRYKGMYVKAKYTDADGSVHYHTVQLQGKPASYWVWESGTGTDGLVMGVCGRQVRFKLKDANGAFATLTKSDFVEDNLEITAPFISEKKNRVFRMSRSIWFGGSASGLAGGTRLFLCGNYDDNEKALVLWSGLNNPLYFPENAYFYVGDTAQAVTGFAKQSDTLVIFKDNEVWYTQYKLNGSISASSLINQSVVDLQSEAVYFPLTQINSQIGCPYPETLQLCRNRLVWLGGNGSVYTLLSENQYNERNIYCVSDMIRQKLSLEDETESIFSADWNGHYMLFVKNRIYVMNYESYGFVYVTSYTKTEDAQKRIPWWYWEMSEADMSVKTVIFSENRPYLVLYPESGGFLTDFKIKRLSDSEETDDGKPIKSVMQTEFFDFGAPNRYKCISSVGFSLGFNYGNEITVTLLSDSGEEQTGIMLENGVGEREAAFIRSAVITPNTRTVLRLGIRLECDGNMSVFGITADYGLLGKAR